MKRILHTLEFACGWKGANKPWIAAREFGARTFFRDQNMQHPDIRH